MDYFTNLVEQRIKDSIKNGEFDKLPGKGKPLNFDDDSAVPSELRMGYKILKNAGMVPEEVQLKKDMLKLEDLIACCKDLEEKEKLNKRLNEKLLRFNMLMEKRKMGRSSAFKRYKGKINRLF
ncbi:J-domain-containing protein [Bacillus sp. Marseille-P3661]|uniref:DnaJ family domain-containing protein n=1 Tax=Bacillus sp. Marseille-P3661 TaxID=1936234 RepID=UPI000C82EBA5|nr:DUF1992 domain-containing protein [Bacillus sp. Marseille-P3661]